MNSYRKAMIIIGHPRSIIKSWPNLNSIFPNTDFYGHMLKSDDLNSSLRELGFKSLKLVDDMDLDLNIYSNAVKSFKCPPCYNARQWIFQVADYARAFEWFNTQINSSQDYDIVMRCRTDLHFSEVEFPSVISENTFYGVNQMSLPNAINDKFFYGTYKSMKKIMMGFNEYLKGPMPSGNSEELLLHFLKSQDLSFFSLKCFFQKYNQNENLVSAGVK